MGSLGRAIAATALVATSFGVTAAPGPAAGQQGSVSDTIQDGEIVLDFTVQGGSITSATPDGLEYSIEGTARPGETISIAASAQSIARNPAGPNEPQAASFDVWFEDSDVREHVTLPPGEGGSLAASLVVPDDVWTVRGVAIIGQTWVNPNGGGSRTLIMRLELEVVEPATTTTEPSTTEPPTTEAPPVVEPPDEEPCDVPDGYYAPTGDRSIVRFGDLYGEVNVRPNCADDDAYIFAELDTPLRHDDRIKTLPRSGAILSFSDLSTFVMGEDSTIVLDIANERESKLGLVAGRVWVNLQRMVDDGSFEVEMGQAVAGIKGTTFIAEESDSGSVVKVFEGVVEVRADAGGVVEVGPGTMVEVTSDGAGPVTDFDVDAELAGWNHTVQETTREAVDGGGGGGGVPVLVAGALVAVVAGGAVALYARNRRTHLHAPTPF